MRGVVVFHLELSSAFALRARDVASPLIKLEKKRQIKREKRIKKVKTNNAYLVEDDCNAGAVGAGGPDAGGPGAGDFFRAGVGADLEPGGGGGGLNAGVAAGLLGTAGILPFFIASYSSGVLMQPATASL